MTKKSWSVGRPNYNPSAGSKPILAYLLQTMAYLISDILVYSLFMRFWLAPSLINLGYVLMAALVAFPLINTEHRLESRFLWTAIGFPSLLLIIQTVQTLSRTQPAYLALAVSLFALTFQALRLNSFLNKQHRRGVQFLQNVGKELRQVEFFQQHLFLNVVRGVGAALLLMGILKYADKLVKFLVAIVIDFFVKL